MTNQKIKPDPIITRIQKELKEKADEKTRQSGERFFKEEVKLYGLKSAHVAEIARRISQPCLIM
jgi:3-methyladenine DNA glycosylase AlkD